MREMIAAILIVGFFGTALRASAQMSSPNYEIQWDTVGTGGNDTSSSSSYILRDTTGNSATGDSSSSSYNLAAGYRQGVFDQVINFSFFAQDNSVIAVADSVSSTTVSVSDAEIFSVGDMVALIQDLGASQVSAIGEVTSTSSGLVTVDSWTTNGAMPVINGVNDYLVALTGTTAAIGTLSATDVRTSLIGMQVHAELPGGYVVQVMSDGDLRSGSNTIDAVSDGAVTAESEEYGARSSDTTLSNSSFDSSDAAITTSFQDVADSSAPAYDERSFLTLKVAISTGTVAASYSQALSLIVSGNY